MGWGGGGWGNNVHVKLNRNGSVICVSWGGVGGAITFMST